MMLGFLALVGVSALLAQRTSATPMPDVPELIDGEHRLHARGPPCSQDTPYGRGPNSSTLTGVDTAQGFSNYLPYSTAAIASQVVLGYTLVNFNQPAIAQKVTSPTLNWINMASYDVQGCANQCSATTGCRSFEVYFQRSPIAAPSLDSTCPNPPSQCHIVCLLCAGPFATADFTNMGEFRGQFQVVIAGNNVFNKLGP